VADVSGTLRAVREQAGLTLEEISARTRIKVAFLEALERGRFEQLPGPFFTRAFLRTYARELHLSPDEIVQAYDGAASQAGRGEVPGDGVHPSTPATLTDRELSERTLRALSPPRWRRWTVVPAALILLVTVVSLTRLGGNDATEPQAVGTTGQIDSPEPLAVPVGPVAAAQPEQMSIEIRTTDPTWITATADGKRVIYRLFQPGDRVTVQARDELSFRLGNAGAFDYSINGMPGTPVGGPGDVREFTITRENYRSLLKGSER
jgi:cytoskeletal protein RodZ